VTGVVGRTGGRGKPAEAVADDAVDLARQYLAAGAPVGHYLADQLMVPLAIAATRGAGECGFRTMPLSRHAATNADVVQAFLPGASCAQGVDGGVRWCVRA